MNEDEERMTQVQHQLATLEKAIVHIHDRISDLGMKLRPILISLPPDDENEPITPGDTAPFVPLAETIHALETRVNEEANRISSFLDRCEL